ncbi:MAG: hypothetical protein ACJA1I_000001 [Zhongshania marina]|jgi:hypothetical protein
MDITIDLLEGVSPFLSGVTYDILKRELVLVAVDDPEGMKDTKKIVFPQIDRYTEDVEEIDDELMESVIGIHWCGPKEICIKTDSREIVISLSGKPYAQSIT